MPIIKDIQKGKRLVKLLHELFYTTGIHGKKDMPEDVPPKGVVTGSLEHLLFITFTVSIDYQRDAPSLWQSARKTFEDPETSYLFVPELLYKTSSDKIKKDMQKYKLSKKSEKDSNIWHTIGISFYKKWEGNPINFIEDCKWEAPIIIECLENSQHEEQGKPSPDFPYLRGKKISSLWLRMLRDNVGLEFKKLNKIPIPVDIHVVRATLTTGIIRGTITKNLNKISDNIRETWLECVEGLTAHNRPMISLDMDEPLWNLSKYGCSKNRNEITGVCNVFNQCEVRKFCIRGKVICKNNQIEVET